MDEPINVSRDNLESLKNKLSEARANLRNARINILKSSINTSKAKVGSFLKTNVEKIKDGVGLLPLMIESRIINLTNKWETAKTARIIKRTERRRILISKIDTAKAKVGNFNKKIVNGVKNGINKIKKIFKPNPDKRAELINELKRQKEELLALKEENKRLREAGSYHNLRGSKGSANYLTIFTITLLAFSAIAVIVIYQIIK